MFRTSLSAFQAFQRCEQQYHYRYVRRLRQRAKDVAPQRGSMIHSYLAAYYTALKDGSDPASAHHFGLLALDEYQDEITIAINAAKSVGRDDLVEGYRKILDDCLQICERYHIARGRADADWYEVLLVEQPVVVEIATGIQSTSIIDLVMKDRRTKRTLLWEHKSVATVPDTPVRLRDFQTLLYAEVLSTTHGIHVDEVLWNYLRTKLPAVPEPLVKGGLTRRKDIDTTWEVYESALLKAGYNPDRYSDMKERLKSKELDVFFPRYNHVIVADTNLLLEDYATTSLRMRRAVWEWEHGRNRPVRTITRDCSWCGYNRVCEVALMGGDEDDIIRRHYRTAGERDPADESEKAE